MAPESLLDLDRIEEELQEALDQSDGDRIQQLIADLHPADLADLLDRLDAEDTVRVFQMLPGPMAAEVLDEADSTTTREVLEAMPSAEAADLLDLLPMDDAAEILAEDVPERLTALLEEMEPEDASDVRVLLQYPPRSAGRLMTEKFVRLRPDMSMAEVLAHLRSVDPEVETMSDLYAVDESDRLVGVVALRQVITAPPEARLAERMVSPVVFVTPETDQEEVARMVARYDFLAIPVARADGRVLGIITVDDVIDVLVEESGEDVLRFGGVEGGEQPYFGVRISTEVRRRVGWLLMLFVAETLTGSVLRFFEGELSTVVALAFFIPLLIGTGGNTGAQTVSTMIRGLALREIRPSDRRRVLARELAVGIGLGTLLGVAAFGRALLWGSPVDLSLVVGLSILAICTWANTIGSLIPLVAEKVGIDPAVVSAPLITTLVDATGLTIYFLIAKVLLHL